jgi:hypothetical protein
MRLEGAGLSKEVRYAKNIVPRIRSSPKSRSLIVQKVWPKGELIIIASLLLYRRHLCGRIEHWKTNDGSGCGHYDVQAELHRHP